MSSRGSILQLLAFLACALTGGQMLLCHGMGSMDCEPVAVSCSQVDSTCAAPDCVGGHDCEPDLTPASPQQGPSRGIDLAPRVQAATTAPDHDRARLSQVPARVLNLPNGPPHLLTDRLLI